MNKLRSDYIFLYISLRSPKVFAYLLEKKKKKVDSALNLYISIFGLPFFACSSSIAETSTQNPSQKESTNQPTKLKL